MLSSPRDFPFLIDAFGDLLPPARCRRSAVSGLFPALLHLRRGWTLLLLSDSLLVESHVIGVSVERPELERDDAALGLKAYPSAALAALLRRLGG